MYSAQRRSGQMRQSLQPSTRCEVGRSATICRYIFRVCSPTCDCQGIQGPPVLVRPPNQQSRKFEKTSVRHIRQILHGSDGPSLTARKHFPTPSLHWRSSIGVQGFWSEALSSPVLSPAMPVTSITSTLQLSKPPIPLHLISHMFHPQSRMQPCSLS